MPYHCPVAQQPNGRTSGCLTSRAVWSQRLSRGRHGESEAGVTHRSHPGCGTGPVVIRSPVQRDKRFARRTCTSCLVAYSTGVPWRASAVRSVPYERRCRTWHQRRRRPLLGAFRPSGELARPPNVKCWRACSAGWCQHAEGAKSCWQCIYSAYSTLRTRWQADQRQEQKHYGVYSASVLRFQAAWAASRPHPAQTCGLSCLIFLNPVPIPIPASNKVSDAFINNTLNHLILMSNM